MKKLCVLSVLLVLASCKNTDHTDGIRDVDTKGIKVNVEIERLERALFKNKSQESIHAFISQNPLVVSYFFKSPIKNDTDKKLAVIKITELINNASLDSVYQASERVFGNMEDIRGQFEEGFSHIKYYYPAFKEPKIQTIITGFSNDKLITDTCMTVGLDFFLGKEIPYEPPVFEYLKNRLQKPYFVHNLMLEISSRYIETDPADETLLASMIGWGKALYFTKAVMPSLHDTIILGYTKKQLDGAVNHEAVIYNHFIKNNLLYSVSHINDKYVAERPYTAEIGSDCPPRIGRWLGYLIVCKYMANNPSVQLPDLMKEKDAKKIFAKSKYKPRK